MRDLSGEHELPLCFQVLKGLRHYPSFNSQHITRQCLSIVSLHVPNCDSYHIFSESQREEGLSKKVDHFAIASMGC